MPHIEVLSAGPLATIQDLGRPNMLKHGISASGAMDRTAYLSAQHIFSSNYKALHSSNKTLGSSLEFSSAGLTFIYHGQSAAFCFTGGQFTLKVNGHEKPWNTCQELCDKDNIAITTGASGNYGYLRSTLEFDVPLVMNSRSTSVSVKLGGFEGRAIRAGDILPLVTHDAAITPPQTQNTQSATDTPIRFIWGIHADLYSDELRAKFIDTDFHITTQMDRMGIRLKSKDNIFSQSNILSLVSDSVSVGDVQILGDGTATVLMRDHQPTGGYPRIATIISADVNRFAQIRPNKTVRFQPVTIEYAQSLLKSTL